MDAARNAVILTALVALSPGAFAESFAGPVVEEKMETLIRALGLSARQQENMRAVLQEEIPRQQAAASDTDRRAVQEESRQRLRALLTDPQKMIFDQMKDGEPPRP